jgi:hypothetical protein
MGATVLALPLNRGYGGQDVQGRAEDGRIDGWRNDFTEK